MKHQLNEEFSLVFYGCDQGIHIMVYQNGKPLTCKKERLKPMRDFMLLDQGVAFKGGLKLIKDEDEIIVSAKKMELPPVHISIFNEAIACAKELPYYKCGESA